MKYSNNTSNSRPHSAPHIKYLQLRYVLEILRHYIYQNKLVLENSDGLSTDYS